MPNQYYENTNPPENATKANAVNESTDRDAIEAGFDLLPPPDRLNSGEINFVASDTGAANAYEVNAPRITALANGQRVTFIPANTNTAASTINVSGLGASAILGLNGQALEAGEIVAGRPVSLIRQGTNWFLQNSAVNARAVRDAAAASANEAAGSANAAAASASAAENAVAAGSNVTAWVPGQNYSAGALAYSLVNYKTYRRKITGAGTTDPANDPVNWTIAASHMELYAEARNSNTALAETDRGKRLLATGTYTQTFVDIALLSPGWFVFFRNAGSGNVTFDPHSSQEIDGLTSYVSYPGEERLIMLNEARTGFISAVLNSFEVTFNSSGTFTKPPGYKAFEATVWSGGASGNKDGSICIGGAGGGCFPMAIPSDKFGVTEPVTVGAGGAASTTSSRNAGGNSSIGSLITVYGAGFGNTSGGFGVGNAFTNNVGASGSFSIFNANSGIANSFNGGYGGALPSATAGNDSGSASWGGGAGGGHDGTLRAAGTSIFGGNGGAAGDTTNGADGAQPSGGGGGTRTGTQSGAGGNGRVIIRGVP
jgi:hypothetical protein